MRCPTTRLARGGMWGPGLQVKSLEVRPEAGKPSACENTVELEGSKAHPVVNRYNQLIPDRFRIIDGPTQIQLRNQLDFVPVLLIIEPFQQSNKSTVGAVDIGRDR